MNKRLLFLILAVSLTACTTKTDVITYNFAARSGVYIVGYTADEPLRRAIETQLVKDIRAKDMQAYASSSDLPVLTTTTQASILDAANRKKAIAIVIVNKVQPEESNALGTAQRVTPQHSNLVAFYEHTKALQSNTKPEEEVFADVSAYLIEENGTRLVWAGTTWSFIADGNGRALSEMSERIASEIRTIQRELLVTQ